MSYLVWDLETTIIQYQKRKASPFHPDNAAVVNITKRAGQETKVELLPQFYDKEATREWVVGLSPEVKVLVGFNIKFDLLYAWHLEELQEWLTAGGTIWDCQYAEYLLEGQQLHAQMCSMDSIVEGYGGTLKVDVVKEYWKQGVCTRDIHEDILLEYCIGDGDNTEAIFLGQVKRAAGIHPNFITMIKARMDGLLATTEMEYNGLKINEVLGEQQQIELTEKLTTLDKELQKYIPELPTELVFNWNSRYHKSFLIFGGTAKYQKWVQHVDEQTLEPLFANKTEKWPLFNNTPVCPTSGGVILGDGGLYRRTDSDERQDTFASGQRKGEGKTKNIQLPDRTRPKGAKADHFFSFPGYTNGSDRWLAGGEDGKGNPLWSTSAEVIEILGRRNIPFLKVMAERQKLNKDLGTYYWQEDDKGNRKGMLTLVNEYDGMIHHGLNHTSTVTTRMSSSNPNCQNLPRGDKSDVKELFTSRYDNGKMAEIDYSQLEVIIQGWLTGDPQLREDIKDGIDFHCKRLSQKLGIPYEEALRKAKTESDPDFKEFSEARTDIKGFSFQRAYGAGVLAVCEATGMSTDAVEQLIEDERVMYPGIEKFNSNVEKTVKSSRVPTDERIFTKSGVATRGQGEWFSPTGTRYMWREHEAPDFLQQRHIRVSFSPPEMKNYPIQGTGGEVMQIALGKLFRLHLAKNRYNGKVSLVNTVHDCLWLDAQEDNIEEAVNDAIRVMQGIPTFIKQMFNIDCGVVFRVDAEVGDNMLNLHHFDSPHYIS